MSNISPIFFNKTHIPPRIGYFKTVVIFGPMEWFEVFLPLVDSHIDFGVYKSMKSTEVIYKDHSILLYSFGYGFVDLNRVITESSVLGASNIIFLNFSFPLKPSTEIKDKDLCVIYASCRNEVASFGEIDFSYPAAAHPLVVRALKESSKSFGYNLKNVKSIVVDGFYEKKVKRKTLVDEIIQTDVELMDWDSSPMLVFSSLREVKSAVLTCVGLKPNMTNISGEFTTFEAYTDQMKLMAKVTLEACVALSKVEEFD